MRHCGDEQVETVGEPLHRGAVAPQQIRPEQINQAFDRVVSKDVRYRLVIDLATDPVKVTIELVK